MKTFQVKLIALLAAVFLAGCTTTSDNSNYRTRGGGWENFRAEAAPTDRVLLSMA